MVSYRTQDLRKDAKMRFTTKLSRLHEEVDAEVFRTQGYHQIRDPHGNVITRTKTDILFDSLSDEDKIKFVTKELHDLYPDLF